MTASAFARDAPARVASVEDHSLFAESLQLVVAGDSAADSELVLLDPAPATDASPTSRARRFASEALIMCTPPASGP